MSIKKLLKNIKRFEINEMLAVGIVFFVLSIPTFIFLEKERVIKETKTISPGAVFIRGDNKIEKENNQKTDTETLMEVIKRMESERPLGIKDGEEILNNPYIRHVRTALNGYLEGTNYGVEAPSLALDVGENTKCGLKSFDKSYYKSKFLIYSAENNDYGGVVANIVFIDNPDTIFWAWVYNIGGDNEIEAEYTLRGFCENGPLDEDKEVLIKIIKDMITSPEFLISCPNFDCLI